MSSGSNIPNPWGPSDSYKDCSQGICSIYCPQWCYIIFPPPPPFSLEDESGTDFSPLIIAVIGILASAFILVSYYTIISKYCRRRDRGDSGLEFSENRDQITSNEASRQGNNNIGLDEALIKSITVCKYKKGDGLVEGTDCSVCLSEFQEDESLRLLPKCSHAFHLPCIDTWLKSHSSCPLCRANIAISTNTTLPSQAAVQETPPAADLNVSVHQYQHRNESVSMIHHDLENGTIHVAADQEALVSVNVVSEDASKAPIDQGLRSDPENLGERHNNNIIQVEVADQPFVRSASLNSSVCQDQGPVLVADILRENIEDDYEMDESIGKSRSGRVMNVVRNPLALKRSVSTGRLILSTRYGKVGNSFNNIPNDN